MLIKYHSSEHTPLSVIAKATATITALIGVASPAFANPTVYDGTYGGVTSIPLDTVSSATLVYDFQGYQPRRLSNSSDQVSWTFEYDASGDRSVRSRQASTTSQTTVFLAGGRAKFDDSGQIRYHIPGVAFYVSEGGTRTKYVPVLNRKQSSYGLIDPGLNTQIRYCYSTLGISSSELNTSTCASQRCLDDVAAYNMLWEGHANLDMGSGETVVDNRRRLYGAQTGQFWHRDHAHQTVSPYVSRGDNPINMNDATGDQFFRPLYERLSWRVGVATSATLATGVGNYHYNRYDNRFNLLREDSRPRTEMFVSEQWVPPRHGGYSGDVKFGEDIPTSHMRDVFSYAGLSNRDEYRTWGGFKPPNKDGEPQPVRSIRTKVVTMPLDEHAVKRRLQVESYVKNMDKTTALLEQYSILSAFYFGGEKDLPNSDNADAQILIANFHLNNPEDFIDHQSDGIGDFGRALTKEFGGMTFIAPDIVQSIVSWDKGGWEGARQTVRQFQDQYSDRVGKVEYLSPAGGIDWGQGDRPRLMDEHRDLIKSNYQDKRRNSEPSDEVRLP